MANEDEEVVRKKLSSMPYLTELMDHGMMYQDYDPSHEVTIVAHENFVGEWKAYIETPQSGSSQGGVSSYGNKISHEIAAEIFPEWEKRLKWRK